MLCIAAALQKQLQLGVYKGPQGQRLIVIDLERIVKNQQRFLASQIRAAKW